MASILEPFELNASPSMIYKVQVFVNPRGTIEQVGIKVRSRFKGRRTGLSAVPTQLSPL